MAGPATLFRELHRLLRYVRDLQDNLDRIPRLRKAHQARLATAEKALRDEQEAIRRLKVATNDKEKLLIAKGEQIARYEQQYNTVTSKRESDALKLEIAHNRDASIKLEEEILNAMMEIDERTAKIPDIEKALAQVRDDVARFENDVGRREADLKAQFATGQADLKNVESQVPADLRPQYERTKSSLGADGMAAARGRICTACNTEMIPNMEMLLRADLFVVCKSCGRILYPPEPTRPALSEEETD